MSSYMAEVHTYDADDWQLVDSSDPYEGTKFQRWTSSAPSSRGARARPRKFATLRWTLAEWTRPYPRRSTTGYRPISKFSCSISCVWKTNCLSVLGFNSVDFPFFFFWQARWFGSLHSNITPWNGASAAVYVCLAPLAFIPAFLSSAGVPVTHGEKEQKGDALPLCLHSVTDRRGRNSVALSSFYSWPQHEKEASRLVDRCERLYQSYVTTGGKLKQ